MIIMPYQTETNPGSDPNTEGTQSSSSQNYDSPHIRSSGSATTAVVSSTNSQAAEAQCNGRHSGTPTYTVENARDAASLRDGEDFLEKLGEADLEVMGFNTNEHASQPNTRR